MDLTFLSSIEWFLTVRAEACLSTQRALLTNLFNVGSDLTSYVRMKLLNNTLQVISNGHRATIRRGGKPVSGVIPPPMGVFYPTPIFGAIGMSVATRSMKVLMKCRNIVGRMCTICADWGC